MDVQRTLRFLKKLKRNNSKKWLDANRDEYEFCRSEFLQAVDQIIAGSRKLLPGIGDQTAKTSVFRINRDIRFSADKSPYKTAFSAVIGPEGRKSTGPIYYLHLEPGSVFVAAGVYLPENYPLSQIRRYIAKESATFLKMVRTPTFKLKFKLDNEYALKKVPAAFAPTHPAADYLRLKSFTISHNFEKLGDHLASDVLKAFRAMKPFNEFLSKALRAN